MYHEKPLPVLDGNKRHMCKYMEPQIVRSKNRDETGTACEKGTNHQLQKLKAHALYIRVYIEYTSYSCHCPMGHPDKKSPKQKQEIHGT